MHQRVIDRMIHEILEDAIIQPSQSYFSLLVVMVTKKDGSWRMCQDYRQLKKMTIKYYFPIHFYYRIIYTCPNP
jgi:hypothetical protein